MKRTLLAMLLVGSCTTMMAQVNDSTKRGSNMGTDNSTNKSTMKDGTNYNNSMSDNGTWNNTTNSDMVTNTSTGNYHAYTATTNVPSYLQSSFTTAYPMASDVTWMQSPEWYRASFNTNGRMTHVYYHQNGSSYTVALPVLNSYVPEEVINKVTSMHGHHIYSIGSQRGMNNQDIYVITLIENGQSRTEWMNADGMAVTDVYRIESTDANAGMDNGMKSDMNHSNMDKPEMNSDMNTSGNEKGGKLKMKAKDGELKIKSESPDGKKKKMEMEKDGKIKTKG